MNEENAKKTNSKKILFIGITIATVLIIGIISFNIPQKRLSKSLELGNKFLTEMNYEQAILEFEKAIAIDEKCIQAYMGTLEAYIGLGNEEETQQFCKKIVTLLLSLDEDYRVANKEEFEKIKEMVIDECLKLANVYKEKNEDDKALEIYDWLIELDITNEKVIDSLEKILKSYIDKLLLNNQYDEIRKIVEKYSHIGLDIEFDSILAQIKELEEMEMRNKDFLQTLYKLMEEKDYFGVLDIYESSEMSEFIEEMSGFQKSRFVYNNGEKNGLGIYIFTKDNQNGYDLYFGNYVNNLRQGQGIALKNWRNGEGYLCYEGNWDNNMPNGQGKVEVKSKDGASLIVETNFNDGFYDGEVSHTEVYGNIEYVFYYNANKGKVLEDKTSNFVAETGVRLTLPEDSQLVAYSVPSNILLIYLKNETLGFWEVADAF